MTVQLLRTPLSPKHSLTADAFSLKLGALTGVVASAKIQSEALLLSEL